MKSSLAAVRAGKCAATGTDARRSVLRQKGYDQESLLPESLLWESLLWESLLGDGARVYNAANITLNPMGK
jgi:hypothetical protein